MFPVDPLTIFILIWLWVGLLTALALRFGWRWRLPFLLLAAAAPAGFLWSDPPQGDYAGLGYIFMIGPSIIMLAVGAFVGDGLRRYGIDPTKSLAALLTVAGAAAGFALWFQYLPESCLDKPLAVRIAGQVLTISPEFRPRLEDGGSVYFFGSKDHKISYARLCRKSRDGAQPVEMDTVWISASSNHAAVSDMCGGSVPPAWCARYDPDLYRHFARVRITPQSRPIDPMTYWKSKSPRIPRQGNMTEGSLCLTTDGDPDYKTQCWIWLPFGDGARITVATNNMNPVFVDMPVEDALELARATRKMVLAKILP